MKRTLLLLAAFIFSPGLGQRCRRAGPDARRSASSFALMTILRRAPGEQECLDASDEWRNSPREAILALIEEHVSVTLSAKDAGIGAHTEKAGR